MNVKSPFRITSCAALVALFACVTNLLVAAPQKPQTIVVQKSVKGFQLADSLGSHLDVLLDGRPVARFMYAWDTSTPERRHETYKPYLHVFDAEGKQPITKGSGGEFTHHRGIFIGWNRIRFDGNSYDRWHMNNGEIVHQEFLHQEAGPDTAVFISKTHWNDTQQEPILVEERVFRFLRPTIPSSDASPASPRIFIDVTSRLTAPRGLVRLDGDPEHAGVQFRPANDVDPKQTVYVFPKQNADPRRDLDYPWVAQTFHLRGATRSVVHMNHPINPSGIRYSAYRDYGRFGAFFIKDIPHGETLTIRHGFLVGDGSLPAVTEIQRAWDLFAGVEEPSQVPTTTRIPVQSAE